MNILLKLAQCGEYLEKNNMKVEANVIDDILNKFANTNEILNLLGVETDENGKIIFDEDEIGDEEY